MGNPENPTRSRRYAIKGRPGGFETCGAEDHRRLFTKLKEVVGDPMVIQGWYKYSLTRLGCHQVHCEGGGRAAVPLRGGCPPLNR